MTYNARRALEFLRLGSGQPNAGFRDGQEEAIRHVVEGRGRLLVVQKTGWGKSFVYFIATKLLREQGNGPALLISPLLALMRNQIAAAERMGVRADTINSANPTQWANTKARLQRNEVDLLLISPERLANEDFTANVLAPIAGRISLLVIDEAHCISDWGHDFRPHYRLLERIVRTLPPNLRLLATTATANNRVMDDLKSVLGPNLGVSRGDLNRPSLALQTMRLSSQAERLAWLASHVPKLTGSGIIYTLTVRDAVQVAGWLKSRGLSVESYSGETGDRRPELEQALLENRVKALVATTALGMGFDKPDLAFVIHYQTPGSVVAYYQQVGRAGRALPRAYGVLLSGEEETDITDFFIRSAFPTRDEVLKVLGALEAEPDGLSVPQLRPSQSQQGANSEGPRPPWAGVSRADRQAGLKMAIDGGQPQRDFLGARRSPHAAAADRAAPDAGVRATALGTARSLPSGHMEFLIRALDGDPGNLAPPTLPPLPAIADPFLVQEAIAYLRRTSLPIEPRKAWPAVEMPRYRLSGRIAGKLQAEPGKALCVWGDAGWGSLVRQGKYLERHFSDELVKACAALLQEWNPRPAPIWVTCVPSLRHPDLVPDFAQRLARFLDLPFDAVLKKTENRPEQKTMENSAQQARNIDGSLAISAKRLRAGPVLLVDDMVDSRWTLTVAAWLLRSHGSGEVLPLALSLAGHEE